jgi:outer membrane protein OmpA-like peptidoglycan-associated protein
MENTFDLRKYLVENALTPNSKFLKEKQLSKEEQDAVDYVLGLDEAVLGDVVSRAKEIAKNGLLKGAVLAALLSSPSITQAQKQDIKQVASITTAAPTQKAPQNAAAYEATPKISVTGAIKTINFGENFASGKSTLTNKEDLISKVTEVKDFLKGKDASKFKVVIVAGESQVTNPKGFEKKGSLAQARAKAVEDVVGKLGFNNVDIQTKIGTTPYKPGNDVNAPEYQAEQFVTISIVANNDICSMDDFDKSEGQGLAKDDYVTYDNYISGVGELILSTGQVPDRLVVLDANGNIKQDTGYITTQVSKYKDWKYTPMYVLELTKAYNAKSKAMDGAKIKTISVKDYKDLLAQLKNDPNNAKAQLQGDEIGPALNEIRGMIQKGQKEFVIYDLGTSDVKVKFDQSKDEVQAKVYSPVGKTGYKITGSCKR